MGDFLSRLNRDTHWKGGGGKVPARGKPLGRRLAAGERDDGEWMAGMECPGKGRRGTRWHRGDGKKVRVWLQRCYLLSAALSKRPLAVSSDTGQVFYGSNGVNGAGWGNKMAKV